MQLDDLTTEHIFNSQATRVIDGLGLCFDMLSMDVCITRQWQTSGRLVQELNVCTVALMQPESKRTDKDLSLYIVSSPCLVQQEILVYVCRLIG